MFKLHRMWYIKFYFNAVTTGILHVFILLLDLFITKAGIFFLFFNNIHFITNISSVSICVRVYNYLLSFE